MHFSDFGILHISAYQGNYKFFRFRNYLYQAILPVALKDSPRELVIFPISELLLTSSLTVFCEQSNLSAISAYQGNRTFFRFRNFVRLGLPQTDHLFEDEGQLARC